MTGFLHHPWLWNSQKTLTKNLVSIIPQPLHPWIHSPAETGLPSIGEAVPQALAVTPEQPDEDTVKEPVQMETFYIWLPPNPLQCWAHISSYNIQHLSDIESKGREMGRKKSINGGKADSIYKLAFVPTEIFLETFPLFLNLAT